MAPVAWKFSGRVAASPDAVFAWMSYYREDDHSSEAFHRGAKTPPKDRVPATRHVKRHEGNTFEIHDSWGRNRFKSKVTVEAATREVRIEGDFGYSSLWRAIEDGTGTRVETEGRVAPKGPAKLFLVFMGKGFMAQMEQDFHGHMEEMRVDLEGQGAGKPAP